MFEKGRYSFPGYSIQLAVSYESRLCHRPPGPILVSAHLGVLPRGIVVEPLSGLPVVQSVALRIFRQLEDFFDADYAAKAQVCLGVVVMILL